MKIQNLRSMALMSGAALLFGIGGAYAATQTVTATIKFFSDIVVSTVASPNFGYVKAAQVGTYALSTAGVLTPSGGGVIEGGVPAAGNYLIKGSATQAINITDSNYVGVGASTPSLGRCKYGAGVEVSCTNMTGLTAPGAAGTNLLVGLTVTTTAAAIDGQTDAPHFDLTIVYQ